MHHYVYELVANFACSLVLGDSVQRVYRNFHTRKREENKLEA